jgi:glucose-6-phosphate 1-dehydrogenase
MRDLDPRLNPEVEIPRDNKLPPPPCAVVIFGATGDLVKRKLLPSFVHLQRENLLSPQFAMIGVGRNPLSTTDFESKMTSELKDFINESSLPAWKTLQERFSYVHGGFDSVELYENLKAELLKADQKNGTQGNYLFYLATPPDLFLEIIQGLSKAGLFGQDRDPETGVVQKFRRVIIEKPFGHDLESAQKLNRDILTVLDESQIYRIDHYLGKETVQNLLVFRFANGIFEPIWDRRYVDHIQVTVAETVGVEHRAGYYETSGALRDMLPNHILQLLTLTMMEPPNSFAADAVRDEKTKVLKALQPFTTEDIAHRVVRGQYGSGEMAGGAKVPSYRGEPGVDRESKTETYAAMKLMVDNWRWSGVPIYIRTGKRMKKRVTEIVVQFRCAPHRIFEHTNVEKLQPNVLVMQIQPDEKISLYLGAKVPGPAMKVDDVVMQFSYKDKFKAMPTTGYETLIHDAMRGDPTLFQRADGVEASWKLVQPVLDYWAKQKPNDFPNYASGSWGPVAADEMLARDGHHWRVPT